jgi:hypothetical protein
MSLAVDQLHALGFTFNDRTEARFAIVAIGNVERETDHADHAAVGSRQRLDTRGEELAVKNRLVRSGFTAQRRTMRGDGGRRLLRVRERFLDGLAFFAFESHAAPDGGDP